MLTKEATKIIKANIDIVNRNIARWVREYKDEQVIKIDWVKLLDYFNLITGKKCTVIPDKVKRQFRARIKEGYTKVDIAAVIKNGYESQHHKESNHKWFNLELCSRSKSFELYLTAKVVKDPHLINPYK